eukprot:7933596-Alexandrium_andersonii.AAC.1
MAQGPLQLGAALGHLALLGLGAVDLGLDHGLDLAHPGLALLRDDVLAVLDALLGLGLADLGLDHGLEPIPASRMMMRSQCLK